MGGLIRVAVGADRRLQIGVPELLLDEVDGCAGRQPERCGGVAEVVQTDARRQTCVSQPLSVAARADVCWTAMGAGT